MESVKPSDLSFKYETFGLKIHSEIPIKELMPLESETPDVIIYLGEVDLSTENLLKEGFNYKVTKNTIFRFWDTIGKFEITKDKIIIEPACEVHKIILKTFLLGTVFATLLRLRGLFVLHASSVNINGNAVAFSGFNGYGKSTTAMVFYENGYPIVSDDYISIEFDNNDKPIITSGFPSLRLCKDSRRFMNLNIDFTEENSAQDKTYLSVPKSFSRSNLLLKKIYMLQRSKESKIIPLTPQEAFIELVKNTFGIYMFSKSELPNNFLLCEKLVKNVNISILKVTDDLTEINEIINLVEEDIEDIL